ncbi:MAG TPA: YIP1 family protein [Herpetosiphonaceae bacterium]
MNTSTSSLSEMINSSIVVLTKPSIATFEQYERRGTTRDALIYVGAAAALAGLAGFIFGLLGGITGAIAGLLIGALVPLLGFVIFASVLFFLGKQLGGTGTQDEVFYTCALYTAPLLAITGVVGAIPLLGCLLAPVTLLLGLYQLYLGYLASRSSMNLNQNNAIISVIVAIIAQLVAGGIITFVVAAIFGTAASLNS